LEKNDFFVKILGKKLLNQARFWDLRSFKKKLFLKKKISFSWGKSSLLKNIFHY